MAEEMGPRTRRQLNRLASGWSQGEHVIVTGPTGSGKTMLGRHLDEIRIRKGGHVVVFIAKLNTDKTITEDYKGWTRWTEWKNNHGPDDNRILLWPDVRKAKTLREKREIQREVFTNAINRISDRGHQTIDFDEGLYMTHPAFMGLADEIAMLHALGRSANITVITKMQRPAHVPLIIFSSASYAFLGQSREAADLKRLSELGGDFSAKELQRRLSTQGRHDFTWVSPAHDKWPIETVNLRR